MADLPLEFTKAMMKQRTALRQPLYDRMNALPGVRSAAVAAFGVMDSTVHTCSLSTPERPAQTGRFHAPRPRLAALLRNHGHPDPGRARHRPRPTAPARPTS